MSVWEQVPTLSTTEALCLLAMERCEEVADVTQYCIEVQKVAAITGLSTSTAGAALRQLAKAGHLEAVPYLTTASNGRPCAKVGYRLPEATS